MSSMELAVQTPADLERLIFEGPETEVMEDPVEIQREILRRILAAESPEAMRAMNNAVPWQEERDVPYLVRDFVLRKSSVEDGKGVFAVVDATNTQTGEQVLLTCGGVNVLGVLYRFKQAGWLPWVWCLRAKERKTASGFTVLFLDDAGLEQPSRRGEEATA